MITRNSILKKTAQVGGYTLLSRILGIIRETALSRYLGPTAAFDVFLTAFKLPNSLRRLFAEGALSAALVPSLVKHMKHENKESISGIMAVSFLFFEGIVTLICMLVMLFPAYTFHLMAPGFSQELVAMGAPLLRVLMPFILFLSCSAIMGAALHAVSHFFVPAIAPILLNIVFITGAGVCLYYNLDVIWLCGFIVAGSALQLLIHTFAYFKEGFTLRMVTKKDIKEFGAVGLKFLLCLPTVSIMEINLFIDMTFASYLPAGDMSLLYLANRFANIPIGVFAVAFATILLPHFSRVVTLTPKRLPFYVTETIKLIAWAMIPTALLMVFFSESIFHTLFLSEKFTSTHVWHAAKILSFFMVGLFSFSLNKILVNVYYALHVTWVPSAIAAIATGINVLFNWMFLVRFGACGIALATALSAVFQTILLLGVLAIKYGVACSGRSIFRFFICYVAQLGAAFALFGALYYACYYAILHWLPPLVSALFIDTIIFWMWVGPLVLLLFWFLWATRKKAKVHVYFLS